MVTTTSTTGETSRKESREKQAALLGRTTQFAKDARAFVRKTPRTLASLGDSRRLVYASGAIGASYIGADEASSRQDFIRKISDCRKESKQSLHWLQLLDSNLEEGSEKMRVSLQKEAEDLQNIFGAIVGKTISNAKKAEEVSKEK